ncbi:MAG: hypothetical protein M3P93_13500, partial [Actinomycetota bacterium]|nr:hypothetical protein [Actinomycetota bacterium]
AAARHAAPDEPGLAAVAGLTLLGALAGTEELADPALTRAGLLAAGGLVALGYACLPERGQVAPLGVALSAGASWTLLEARDVDLLEAYTLPVAALLLVVGLVRWHRAPDAPSWTTVGPAAALALVPSAQRALSDPHGLRALLVTVAAVVVLLVGLQLRAQALVVTGGLVVLEMALLQVGEAALFVPRWLVLGTLGALLLAAGATYEARVEQARVAARWIRALR